MLIIECDYLVDIGVSSSVLVILSFVSQEDDKRGKGKDKGRGKAMSEFEMGQWFAFTDKK